MKRKKKKKNSKLVCWNCGTTLNVVRAASTPGSTEYLICNNGQCEIINPQYLKEIGTYRWRKIK